jgi:hypothetical protein
VFCVHLVLQLLQLLQLPASLQALRQLYLAGTFPINGSDGWQGGQVITKYTVKKGFSIFPSPARMSQIKLSLAGNNLITPG